MELRPVLSQSGFMPSLFIKPKEDEAPPNVEAVEGDSVETEAVEEPDSAGADKLPETLGQHAARLMAELFGAAEPDGPANIFEKLRQMHKTLMDEMQHPAEGAPRGPSDRSEPTGTAQAPSRSVEKNDSVQQQSFSIDISIKSVFERIEELVRVAGERRGDRVLAAASSVLRRQSASMSLDFSFTAQFLDQGIDLAAIDEELLDPFMDAAMGLSEFDDDSLQTFMGAVETLFNGLEDELGLQDGALQGNEDLFKKMTQRYFDSVQNILAAPSILDEEGRDAVLSVPPDDEYFRKTVADIFRDAGGIDAAKRMVAGANAPSDLEILMDKIQAKQKANRKKKKQDAPEGETGEGQAVEEGSVVSGQESAAVPETVRLAKENMLAVSSGFSVDALFQASRFLGVLSESGSSQPGLVRDVVA